MAAGHDEEREPPLATLLGAPDDAASVDSILAVVREHLDMDVAFVGQFTGGARVFRHVSAAPGDSGLPVGGGDPLEATYCQRITSGTISGVIPDARRDPVVGALEVTERLGIGAYVGAPVVFSDGRVYGTLCSYSHAPDATLNERDGRFMRAVAGLIAERLERDVNDRERREHARARIADALAQAEPAMVFQPIVDLVADEVVGYEALARFGGTPPRPPDVWFADAATAALGVELEIQAVRNALRELPRVAADRYVSVNVSPQGLCTPQLLAALTDVPRDRVIVEITEHDIVHDVAAARDAIDALRDLGVRVAIDDAGAGFAGLTRIVDLAPNVVKLDRAIIATVDRDVVRQSLVAAAVRFADALGGTLVAEGIETPAELDALRAAGVRYGQGYLLGRPAPLP